MLGRLTRLVCRFAGCRWGGVIEGFRPLDAAAVGPCARCGRPVTIEDVRASVALMNRIDGPKSA